MAHTVEFHAVEAESLGEPVEGVVSGQRVRPLVAEDINGLGMAEGTGELDQGHCFRRRPGAIATRHVGA